LLVPNESTSPAVAHLRLRAEGLAASIKSNLLAAAASEFPADGPKAAINILLRVLKLIRADAAASDDKRTLVIYCQCLEALARLLEYFDNAETEQTPRGLSQLLEMLVRPLKPDAQFVLWPRAEYNYQVERLQDHVGAIVDVMSTSESAQAYEEILKSEVLLVSFPRVERDNVLQHAILGHELGHHIAEEFLAHDETTVQGKERLKRLVDAAKALASGSSEPIEANGDQAGDEGEDEFEEETEIVEEVLTIRKRALEELISDAVAIYLFGPSALLALYDFLMSGGWDELPDADDYYPPSRMRLRLALRVTREEGFLNVLNDLTSGVRGSHFRSCVDRIQEISDLTGITLDEDKILAYDEIRLAYSFVEESLSAALAFAKKKIGLVLYGADLAKTEVAELVDRIANNLPPNEVGFATSQRSVDARSALLAAWVWRAHCKNDDGSPCSASEVGRVNLLTLKAIEYIWLQKMYTSFEPPKEDVAP
jgi:hypothetical protein